MAIAVFLEIFLHKTPRFHLKLRCVPPTVISLLDYFQKPTRLVANVKIFYHKLGLRALMRSKVKSTHKNVCECLMSKEMSRVNKRTGQCNGRNFLRMWRKEVRSKWKPREWG